eukprot:TRINITY_DN29513_c1_g1_i1.p1 TRINITY_DN29513_c1_g1~~TRINITY_DN29513_c1_g1_i1.p1  ORF type:complete len:177 (-),score=28.60 TRINITY_DN29513_c1_g1_i1:48-527(-)
MAAESPEDDHPAPAPEGEPWVSSLSAGERDLCTLLEQLSPSLADGEGDVVFVTCKDMTMVEAALLQPRMMFQEEEGLTLVLAKAVADAHGLAYDGVFCRIVLKVHSSLAAVGLTAAVSRALTDEGICANVVAAFYHDHVYVPSDEADRALRALTGLSGR